MACKNPLCPKRNPIALEKNLFFLPIFEVGMSISGKTEKSKTAKTNNSLCSISKKCRNIKDEKSPNAIWV